MRLYYIFLLWLLATFLANAQMNSISGTIVDNRTKNPLPGILISIEGTNISVETDDNGIFKLKTDLKGEQVLNLMLADYVEKRMPIDLQISDLNLGIVFLEKNSSSEQADNLITLTDSELLDDDSSSASAGLLQATRDVFLNRAAFDFGQAFFRVRGYDSQNGKVLLNGAIYTWFATF